MTKVALPILRDNGEMVLSYIMLFTGPSIKIVKQNTFANFFLGETSIIGGCFRGLVVPRTPEG